MANFGWTPEHRFAAPVFVNPCRKEVLETEDFADLVVRQFHLVLGE